MSKITEVLNEIHVFQVSDSQLHLYLGTMEQPGSSVVVIRGQRIGPPVRIPPISSENLQSRYENQSLDFTTIFPKIRLLLAIFGAIDLELVEKDATTENSSFILTTPWDPKLEQVDDFIIPITEGIKKAVVKPGSHEDLIGLLMSLFGDPIRGNRQKALTQMVSTKDPSFHCILSIFLMVRPELTVAVIREFGRHAIKNKSLITQCHGLIQTEDKAYEKFGYAYLHQFDGKELHSTKYHQNKIVELAKYLELPLLFRLRKILVKLKNNNRAAAEAFSIFQLIDDFDEFQFELTSLYKLFNPKKVDILAMRSAIVDLVQDTETSQDTRTMGFVMALSSMYDKISISDNLTFEFGLNSDFRHVRQRILSQFHIWKSRRQHRKIREAFLYFLAFIPPFEIINTTNSVPSDLSDQWIKLHPILSLYQSQLVKIWEENKLVSKIIYHSTQINSTILDNLIETNNWEIDDQELLFLQKVIVHNNFPELQDQQIRDTGIRVSDDQLRFFQKDTKLLKNLRSAGGIISKLSLNETCRHIINNNQDIQILQEYITSVAKHDKEIVKGYFNILEKIIMEIFDIDIPNEQIKEIILQIILPWQSITGIFPDESTQQFIDTFKIIYQSEIEDFDLESSKPLGIETIVNCYKVTGGEIPKFIESNIQFSFTKPVWDQLARHYLALGIQRPKREAIAKSKLKDVPNYLTRDVLGQIALVNQTLSYCERNGFRPALENLIINNMYRRGWNVERGLERTLPSLFGSVSSRLRSYFAAYLVIDQGEISLDMLKWARDVEDYLLRDRILRELDRYGTPDMYVVLANAYHPDISKGAVKGLKETRMNATQRSKTTIELLASTKELAYELGIDWLEKNGVQQDDILSLLTIDNPMTNEVIIDYLANNKQHLTSLHHESLHDLILRHIWKPSLKQSTKDNLALLIPVISDAELQKNLRKELMKLADTPSQSKINIAISSLAALE